MPSTNHLSRSIFNSTTSRIVIAVVSTALVALAIVGAIAFYSVNQGFDVFLQRQGYGYGNGQGSQQTAHKVEREQEIIDEFKNTLTRSLLIASVTGGTIALFLGILIARQIASPLRKLQAVIQKVKQNNYKIKAEVFGPEDISELIREFNELLTELERLEALREELVSDVAHELKTPLTKIQGQLEGIIDGVYESTPERLSNIVHNVDQLEFLIERLQDLSQLKAGKIRLHRTEVNLNQIAGKVIAGYQKDGVNFQVNIAGGLKLNADENRMTSILDNLVSNATKHTDKGEIIITADEHSLLVRDTGKGIPAEHLPYVFERFYRADKSRDRKTGGLGLGLAIVKETVEAHGWTITIDSQPGQGTTCTILY